MPLLRKVGIRLPWQPAPLEAGAAPPADALRPVIVIGAIVPALLLGGITQPIGVPSREPNLDPLRITTVQGVPVPVPGATVWMPTPARLPNTDPLRPAKLLAGQQPIPGAVIWAPTPARLPNSDPLRPVTLVSDAPDATLAQPAAYWTGRLPRDEDTTRPARPAVVAVGAQPVPGALLIQTRAWREAAAAPPTDRLAPAWVLAGQTPQPGAQALLLRVPRDQVVVAAERLSPTLVIGTAVAPPGASAWRPTRPGAAPDRIPSTGVLVVSTLLDRPPDASAWFLRVVRELVIDVAGRPIVLTLSPRGTLLHVALRDNALVLSARAGVLSLSERADDLTVWARTSILTIRGR